MKSARRAASGRKVQPVRRETCPGRPRASRRTGSRNKQFVSPTAAELQKLWLPTRRGQEPFIRLNGPVSVESGLVNRDALVSIAADRPGFAWDVPGPDPTRTVLWASLGFDWQFYEWATLPGLVNDTNNNMNVSGGLIWSWYLSGNPYVFSRSWVYLQEVGPFSFETFVAPGGDGFDVGWLTWPLSQTFSAIPDKTDASMTSPLQRLLAMESGGVLKLWFSMDFQDVGYWLDDGVVRTGGWTINGGPKTIYYAYAYASMANEAAASGPLMRG